MIGHITEKMKYDAIVVVRVNIRIPQMVDKSIHKQIAPCKEKNDTNDLQSREPPFW